MGCLAGEPTSEAKPSPETPSPATESQEELLPGGRLQVLPSGDIMVNEEESQPEKGRWQHRRIINGTFTFAQNRTRTRLESAGFTVRHEIELGKKPRPAVLMLWENGDRQVMVLLRRLELNRTECLEGEVQDGK